MGNKLNLATVMLASSLVAGCSGIATRIADSVGIKDPDVELDERISRNGVPARALHVTYRDNADPQQERLTNEFYSFEWCSAVAEKFAAKSYRAFDGDCLTSAGDINGSVHFDGDNMTYSR